MRGKEREVGERQRGREGKEGEIKEDTFVEREKRSRELVE